MPVLPFVHENICRCIIYFIYDNIEYIMHLVFPEWFANKTIDKIIRRLQIIIFWYAMDIILKICYKVWNWIISCTKCITISYTSSYCFNPSTIQGWRCVRIWCTSHFISTSNIVFLAFIVSINVNQLLLFNTMIKFP